MATYFTTHGQIASHFGVQVGMVRYWKNDLGAPIAGKGKRTAAAPLEEWVRAWRISARRGTNMGGKTQGADAPRSLGGAVGGLEGNGDRPDLVRVREAFELRKLKAEAERAELRVARERGEVLSREFVYREWARTINDARTLLQALPDQLGLLIAGDAALHDLIVGECRRGVEDALRLLAGGKEVES